jgi:hypothetical protein
MSAAATAAGYLYASGRLRGKAKEGETPERDAHAPARPESAERAPARRRIRVAAIRETAAEPYSQPPLSPSQPAARSKPAPRIEYRTRRWRPDE